MYKIIACDLDETLLSDDRSISKENIEAIQKAKELGVKFVPATGRGYNTVDGTLKELSEKVGVSNVNLSKMKTGKISAIRFSTLEAICNALDCQPGDILEYSPENKDTPQS